MHQNHLLTCAILKVNNSKKSDYLENLSPFVSEVIRIGKEDIISSTVIKEDLYNKFGLEIPIQVINTILKKKLIPKKHVEEKERVLFANREVLETTNFSNIQERLMEKHEKLVSELIIYALDVHNIHWTNQKAEEVLETFIRNNSVNLLINHYGEQEEKKKFYLPVDQKGSILISAFIRENVYKNTTGYQYLMDVVKGLALSNVFNISTPENILMKFKKTDVFLDTSFIVRSLGLNGKSQMEPCTELLKMLREYEAKLKCFRHNLDEIIGILEYTKHNLNKGVIDTHGTIQHLITEGYDELKIDKLIYNLEDNILKQLGIEIIEKITYNENKIVVPENELEIVLKENVRYKHNIEQAVYNDVQSVLSIMRLREGVKSQHVEDCKAVFVTTNFSFAKAIGEYFSNQDEIRTIPPILHDSIMTNLIWLKQPSKAPDLPFKKLVADCYAALQPNEYLWNRYIETMNLLKDNSEASEEDIVLLRYSPTAKYLLVSKTLGDQDELTIGTVQEILEEVKQRKLDDHVREVNELKAEKEKVNSELNSAMEQIAYSVQQKEKAIEIRAERQAKFVTNGIIGGLSSVVLFIFLLIQNINSLNLEWYMKLIISIIPLFILQILSLFGIYIKIGSVKQFFENYFKKRIKKKFYDF